MCYEHLRLRFPCFCIVKPRKQHFLNHYFLHSLQDSFSLCIFSLVLFSLIISLVYCFLSVPNFLPFCFCTYPVSEKKIIIFRTAPSCWFAHSHGLDLCSLCCHSFCHAAILFTHFSETLVSIYHAAQFHM